MSGYCYSCMNKLNDGSVRTCPICKRALFKETPPHHLPAGTVLKNRYVVGYSIGEGGFGITYIGHDTILDMKVAIKEFYPTGYVNRSCTVSKNVTESTAAELRDFFENGKERFLSEARVLARFSGYNGIAAVRDFFDDNNTAYLVMEYVDGITLSDYLKENGIIRSDKAIQMLTPVMYALKEIHSQNIIHCDINPKNIMICKDGNVKLLDFGAAKRISGAQNPNAPLLLCPGYSPVEQYRTNGVQGPWTDIYSLCAVLYKCITGKTPIEAVERLAGDALVPPSETDNDIGIVISNVLMKGLAVRHEDRFSNIEQLIDALSCRHERAAERTVCIMNRHAADTDESRTVHVFKPLEESEPNHENKADEAEQKALDNDTEHQPINRNAPQKMQSKKRLSKPLMIALGSLGAIIAAAALFFFLGYKVTICGETFRGASTHLELVEKAVTTADIVELSKMPFLRSVSFDKCGLQNVSSEIAMSSGFRVRELSFRDSGGGIDYLIYNLPHKEALRTLKIESCGDWLSGSIYLNFEHLSGLRELKIAYLPAAYAANWEQVKHLESFTSFNVNFSSDYSDLLCNCEKLKTLTLSGCYVGDITFIEKLPKLKYLELTDSTISNADFLKTYDRAAEIEIHTDSVKVLSY